MSFGGIRVTFTGNQTLYGSYGGADGKPASITDSLYAGAFKIDVCEQSPVIILYRTATPIRVEPIDNNSIFNFDVKNDVLGRGKAHGFHRPRPVKDEPGKFRFSDRLVFTF